MNVEQSKRMEQEAVNLVFHQPFFGTLLMHLRRIETGDIQTMAVDGRNLYWSPHFAATLSKAEMLFVLAHEVMHCALRHFTRAGDRHPMLWNMATDICINRELVAAGFTMPACASGHHDLRSKAAPKDCRCGLLEPRFDGLCAEEVYRKLYEEAPRVAMRGAKGAKGQKGGNGSAASGDGTGDAYGRSGADPGMCGGIIQAKGGAESAELAADWEVRIRQAAQQAQKTAGHVPGSITELIDKLNNPQIDWRSRLRAFVGEALSPDVTWQRPSRRLIGQGYHIPSRSYDAVTRIMFIYDTSGSMSKPELRAALSEAEGILSEGLVAEIIWADVDTRVAAHGVKVLGDTFEGHEIVGRGGTDFREPMRWAAEQPACACVIFFTDGATNDWGDAPNNNVLLLGTPADETRLKAAPYGEYAIIRLTP